LSSRSSETGDAEDRIASDYASHTKAALIREFRLRNLDAPFMSDLKINSRTRKDDLIGALLDDDFLCQPCWCPAHQTERELKAGNPDAEVVQRFLAEVREEARLGWRTQRSLDFWEGMYLDAVREKRMRERRAERL
jgi:hypothetical protein